MRLRKIFVPSEFELIYGHASEPRKSVQKKVTINTRAEQERLATPGCVHFLRETNSLCGAPIEEKLANGWVCTKHFQ